MTRCTPAPADRPRADHGVGSTVATLLPGAGSDGQFLRRVFADALAEDVVSVRTVEWTAGAVIESAVRALDDAAAQPGPMLVGGVSLGASVALRWALRHPDRTVGVLVAMPAWLGDPRAAPAADNARRTAASLRAVGLRAVLETVRDDAPPWLSTELTRAWSGQWPQLPEVFEACGEHWAPTRAELAGCTVPVGVAAVAGDPLHPVTVARAVASAVPRGALVTVGLDEVGADPGALGRATVSAWRAAQGR